MFCRSLQHPIDHLAVERGVTDARGSTLDAIEKALNKAGVIFLDAGDMRDGGRGVRLVIRSSGTLRASENEF